MAYRMVTTRDELRSGEMRGVVVDGVKVLVVALDGEVFAYEDRCAHMGVPISRGWFEGSSLVCSLHNWEYDARTGEAVNPRGACLKRFPVRVEGEAVWVSVEGDEP
jgi:toluene monooxygenase system ferredoxin subunit